MSIRVQRMHLIITLLTLGVIVVSIMQPALAAEAQLLIGGLLLAVVGIPHGASDYLIFRSLVKQHYEKPQRQQVTFLTYYTFLLLGYALVWFAFPTLAFLIFLFLSFYHFGQSNLNYITTPYVLIRIGSYLAWGAFVILTPVCIHSQEASAIIASMTGEMPTLLAEGWVQALPRDLVVINVWLFCFLYFSKMIALQDFLRELVTLFLLTVLFFSTPLLLGFFVYFGLWHSLGSVLDQVDFVRRQTHNLQYSYLQYYKDAAPMTILSFAGMAALWYAQSQGWLGYSLVALLFVTISVVTLPHMLLIERLYERLAARAAPPTRVATVTI